MATAIHTPGLTNIDNHSDNSATFSVEPLHTGYGMTLGNSLRRVLLSSIEGSAIVAFKIEGATHEFTTVEGVKEDVVEIMLNLKQVRVKSASEEAVDLRIEKTGGVVTAGDIQANADIEIVNKDAVIATLDGKAKFVMDLKVQTGRGYQPLEEGKGSPYGDMIALDAMYSPVLRVRYKVESTRVGQNTDLDKLNITIDTDGSITPSDAFEEAAAILITQYQALAGATTIEATSFADEAAEQADSEESNDLSTPIEELSLSARTSNALLNNDIQTVKDLVMLSDGELRELKGFGAKALDEVREKLTEIDL